LVQQRVGFTRGEIVIWILVDAAHAGVQEQSGSFFDERVLTEIPQRGSDLNKDIQTTLKVKGASAKTGFHKPEPLCENLQRDMKAQTKHGGIESVKKMS
jgi:hypothetical protein